MAVSSAHAWFSPFQYRFIDTRQNSSKNKVWRDWKSRTDQVVNRPPRRANRVLIERTCLQSGMRQRDSVYSENALNSTRNLCWKKRKKLDRTESNDSKTNRGCYKFRGNPFHVQLTVFPRSFFFKDLSSIFFLVCIACRDAYITLNVFCRQERGWGRRGPPALPPATQQTEAKRTWWWSLSVRRIKWHQTSSVSPCLAQRKSLLSIPPRLVWNSIQQH